MPSYYLIMAFSKSFPKKSKLSNYPEWEEIILTAAEEKLEESNARNENINLMKECIEDAKEVIKDKKLKDYQTDLISIAVSLFEKRASHTVHFKENKAKEKFDKIFNK